jgi:hypothetical protein
VSLDLHHVPPERRPLVALDAIAAAELQWRREHRRPKALTPREALAALLWAANFVSVAAGNLRSGVRLTDDDFETLALAYQWTEAICKEAL